MDVVELIVETIVERPESAGAHNHANNIIAALEAASIPITALASDEMVAVRRADLVDYLITGAALPLSEEVIERIEDKRCTLRDAAMVGHSAATLWFMARIKPMLAPRPKTESERPIPSE